MCTPRKTQTKRTTADRINTTIILCRGRAALKVCKHISLPVTLQLNITQEFHENSDIFVMFNTRRKKI